MSKSFLQSVFFLISLILPSLSYSVPIDLALEEVVIPRYVVINQSTDLSFKVFNATGESVLVQAFNVHWQIDSGEINSHHVVYTNSGLMSNESSELIKHDNFIKVNELKSYILKVWLSTPGEYVDSNPANDTLKFTFRATSQYIKRRVLIEEMTGTWCSWSPIGTELLDNLMLEYPSEISALSVHIDDSLETEASAEVFQYLQNTYVPAGAINRIPYEDEICYHPFYWLINLEKELTTPSPVSITMNTGYDKETRVLSVDLFSKFYANLKGNFRWNVFLVEDSLHGTGTGWDQLNGLNTDTSSIYYQRGTIIKDFVHNHVFRTHLGGVGGSLNVFEPEIYDQEDYSYHYQYTIPEKWNIDNMKIIAVIYEHDSLAKRSEILNAAQGYFFPTTRISNFNSSDTQINIYPNPVFEQATISLKKQIKTPLEVIVYNQVGQMVITYQEVNNSNNNEYSLDISHLPKGNYFISMTFDHKTFVKQLIKK